MTPTKTHSYRDRKESINAAVITILVAGGLLTSIIVVFSVTPVPNRDSAPAAQVAQGPVHQPLPTAETLTPNAPWSYRVVDMDTTDTRERRQVKLSIVLDEVPDKEDLERLLFRLEAACESLHEFTYYRHIYGARMPTHIFVDVYLSEAQVGSGVISASLGRTTINFSNPNDYNVRIYIAEEHFAAALSPPEERFGLTEEYRKTIYGELAHAEGRAREEADAISPPPDLTVSNAEVYRMQLDQNLHIFDDLLDRYQAEIMERHAITDSVFFAIMAEGVDKGWPY